MSVPFRPLEQILCVSLDIHKYFHVVMIHNALGEIVTMPFEIDISSHFITPDLNSGTLLQGEHDRAPVLAQPRRQFPRSEWTG